ncbi:hypothetical protein FA95DRAFT_1464700, partial [Auriscalpium vulgare]
DVATDSPTYPWPSMAMYITHLLFSSPRLQFSDAQKKAVLSWARELRAPDVPTLDAIKKCQQRIETLIGDPTEKVTAQSGNIFYINSIGKAVAKDFSNPLTRFCMEDYPEFLGQTMSEVRHGEKMLLDIPADVGTPMVRVDGKIFYVDELLETQSGSYFIPERFFNRAVSDTIPSQSDTQPHATSPELELVALGRNVAASLSGFTVDNERVIAPVSDFSRNFFDILGDDDSGCDLIPCPEESAAYRNKMPNAIREQAGDRMVYAVPLIIFVDDVSGNISKQWNKHYVVYLSNASLPREMLEKEFCVRFVSSSPHATPPELIHAVRDSINAAATKGVDAWDCKHNEEVMLRPYALFLAGDNPMHAEECSQGGLACNFFCRTCKVGGTREYKQSDEGYSSMFKETDLRRPEETRAEIERQLQLALESGGTEKFKAAMAETGIRDAATLPAVNFVLELGKSLRKRAPGKPVLSEAEVKAKLSQELEKRMALELINPLIGMPGVNIHMDTPTEILHTVLLGVVKYFWAQTIVVLDKSKSMAAFHARLVSVRTEGLNTPSLNADYICQYGGSLIGKHFKGLAQIMSFLVCGLVTKEVLDAWNAIGALVVLLWHTEIKNLEEYLASLSRAIEDLLNLTARCAPSILISKPKFHFLVHLPAYIRRFGPAIVFSTERYESFNHVFRLTCIHSNRQAPSRDTCRTFALHDAVKHIATGGFWLHRATKQWVRAGPKVRSYLREHPEHVRLLGINVAQTARKREPPKPLPWSDTRACSIIRATSDESSSTRKSIQKDAPYHQAQSFVARDGDSVATGYFVIFKKDNQQSIGRVIEILSSIADPYNAAHISVEEFKVLDARHPHLDLPCLDGTAFKHVISPDRIICNANVQHDCTTSGCKALQQTAVRQERSEAIKTRATVLHEPTDRYLALILPDNLRHPTDRGLDADHIRSTAARQLREK